ncbi:hypothetical protein [Salmonella phage SPT-1]|uniref:Uncharacterized protein n=1 Tax=Salmonella phage SPT-1 TaxID=1198117 RepID=K4I350_9CAUD|nr:hypothetical protein [Salmonella phage SPT-1]
MVSAGSTPAPASKFTEDRLQQNLNNLFLGKEKEKVRFLHSAGVELV